MNIYDLISRAQKLRQETKLDSVSPGRVGALCEDTLKYINEYQLLASSPSLHKIYASVSAMQSDPAPKSDLTGKALKPGQLVVIAPASQTDTTAGDVYRYDGPSGNTSAWTFVAKIVAVPADAELNATSANPVQNKVLTEILSNKQEILVTGENIKTINGQSILGSGNIIIQGGEGGSVTVDSELSETSTNAIQNKAVTKALNSKVEKVDGKQLSTEDFTSAFKAKLEGLNNYDDTSIRNAVDSLITQINTLVSGDASIAIESFNEIMAFLDGIKDTQSLAGIIAAIEQQIAGKQGTISDLDTIRANAAKGASIVVDAELSETSGNPIANKAVTDIINLMGIEFTDALDARYLILDNNKANKTYVDSAIAAAITNTLNTEV